MSSDPAPLSTTQLVSKDLLGRKGRLDIWLDLADAAEDGRAVNRSQMAAEHGVTAYSVNTEIDALARWELVDARSGRGGLVVPNPQAPWAIFSRWTKELVAFTHSQRGGMAPAGILAIIAAGLAVWLMSR